MEEEVEEHFVDKRMFNDRFSVKRKNKQIRQNFMMQTGLDQKEIEYALQHVWTLGMNVLEGGLCPALPFFTQASF